MELLTLAEAWRWIQVGFFGGLGAGIVLTVFNLLVASATAVSIPAMPNPHCSRCCPNAEDDEL